jgi:hypothetical protein
MSPLEFEARFTKGGTVHQTLHQILVNMVKIVDMVGKRECGS